MPRFHRRFQFPPKANVPMVTETRDRLALEIRMAGESLIGQPTIDSYNTLSKMFAALERAGMSVALVRPGSKVMCAICDRYEQTRSITVEREEAAGLRQAIADIDAGLRQAIADIDAGLRQAIADIDAGLHRIPLQRFAQAVAEVEVFVAAVDLPNKEN